ncbi:MAG TPA: recombinase family protein [Gemmataceae bacterium]|jgi:DNA invertase Pin-like site-specific DNA recombinase
MNGSAKIRSTHRQRQAVVYLRQSSSKQVLENQESAVNQRALRERLIGLGWTRNRIDVIDEDQGRSAKHTAGREGFQRLVADVSLGKIGIIIGYEVSRLSRNCADWHRLLELCALFDTLLADADGIYHPRDFNDRLLLGLKGTLGEAELHSLRLRLDAGRLSKAKRAELVQHLPTGYTRDYDGNVQFDADVGIQERIRLVLRKFLELGSGQKVLHYLVTHALKLPRRQTSGLYAGEVLWKDPSASAVRSILKNPAYAGAFAYGRRITDPTRQIPGRPSTGRIRQPQTQWLVLVQDVYPAYITWVEYEQIQARIAENRQKMADRFTRRRALRQGAALLTGLVRCGKCGRAMHVAYKDGRFQYVCNAAHIKYAKRTCQYLAGEPIDAAVVQAFFEVLHPAEIDALEHVSARCAAYQRELVEHLEKEVLRLEYQAKRAERQYHCVDPENRLIAATLEKQWEEALVALEQTKSRLVQAQEKATPPIAIPMEMRQAFTDVGRCMSDVWPGLSMQAKKELLRTLVTGVNLHRQEDGTLRLRIVWRGEQVTERVIRMRSLTLRGSQAEQKLADRVRELSAEGLGDSQIAERLNAEGFVPCRADGFTPVVVVKVRRRHRITANVQKAREGSLPCGYKIPEIARLLAVDPSWIYRLIARGVIQVAKDSRFGCYLFPRKKETIHQLRQLKHKEIAYVSFPAVH